MRTTSRRTRALAATANRWLAVGAIMLFTSLVTAQTAAAQATPEGTVITNTASASWTDANSNTYTAVTANISVTVGFTAGISVTSPVSVTPASPSTANQFNFTAQNTGNGTDTVAAVAVTPSAGVTVTGYKIGATSYATLALLQAALDATTVTAGSSVTITIVYDVASGRGGQTIPVAISAASRRTPATTNSSTTNVMPPVAASVVVTPVAANVDRLPSNGTQYSQVFPVQNTGNASDTYNLVASLNPGTAITIVSVNGTAGASSTVTVASGATQNVTVVYTVGNVAAGTTDKLTLTATSQNDVTKSAAGDVTARVVKAALTFAKAAYRDNQTTVINPATDKVLPGEYIQYKLTVTNGGLAAASTVAISDPLPAAVTWQSTAGDVPADWSLSQAAGTVTANLTPALAAAGSRFIWIRVRVK